MGIVSGDMWQHSRNSPIVEGIEYFNYSNHDLIVTDRLGIEMEILRSNERPEDFYKRGKLVARITRLVDPRRVQVPIVESQLKCDQEYLIAFKEAIEKLRSRVGEYEPETNQIRYTIQIEMCFDFVDHKSVHKSNLLGITIRELSNISERSYGTNPIGYINEQIVKELEEIDHEADNYTEKGIRTLFSARLIDNTSRIGVLWTTGFGDLTRIAPIKDEDQEEGLYLAGGLRLEHKRFIPISELADPKKLLALNLHGTEREARKHSTGEYTISVTTENDKLKKEGKDLRAEVKKLNGKVEDLETKNRIEKLNRAQSDFKQTVQMEKLKEYGADNLIGSATRLIGMLIGNFKTIMQLMAILKI